ncbi:MAG: aspartate-semialdehyde dehydrogenase [Sulfolobaceae archaeon]
MDKIKVSLLGATGIVGQKMVKILAKHPYFEINKLSASPQKKGMKYIEAVKWVESGEVPEEVRDLRMVTTEPAEHKDSDLILSALPNDIAENVEISLVKEGKIVISNASPYRMDDKVPLINPEVNWQHLELLKIQRDSKNWKGLLIKNPNCTAAIISLSLKPLHNFLKFDRIYITTLQSVSGAGYNGLSFMSIYDNVIPYIKGEEEKISKEINKMLGKINNNTLIYEDIKSFVTATRVPIRVGHMAVIQLSGISEDVSIEEIKRRLSTFKSLPQEKELPTAPKRPIIVMEEEDRPQPARDLSLENGMAISVGRIKVQNDVIRFIVLGDNLVRGAAGITILTAEVMKSLGYI